jgi:hypothetical protein
MIALLAANDERPRWGLLFSGLNYKFLKAPLRVGVRDLEELSVTAIYIGVG